MRFHLNPLTYLTSCWEDPRHTWGCLIGHPIISETYPYFTQNLVNFGIKPTASTSSQIITFTTKESPNFNSLINILFILAIISISSNPDFLFHKYRRHFLIIIKVSIQTLLKYSGIYKDMSSYLPLSNWILCYF